jgi:hypothetical protein
MLPNVATMTGFAPATRVVPAARETAATGAAPRPSSIAPKKFALSSTQQIAAAVVAGVVVVGLVAVAVGVGPFASTPIAASPTPATNQTTGNGSDASTTAKSPTTNPSDAKPATNASDAKPAKQKSTASRASASDQLMDVGERLARCKLTCAVELAPTVSAEKVLTHDDAWARMKLAGVRDCAKRCGL